MLQQIDENGEWYAGRVIVDSKLKAWNFDEKGRLVEVNPPVIVPDDRMAGCFALKRLKR